MSIVFVPKKLRGKAKINQETIQRLLDENDQLVRCITEYMQKGRAVECVQYQQILHRNIVYLATIADASPDSGAPATDVRTSRADEHCGRHGTGSPPPTHRLVPNDHVLCFCFQAASHETSAPTAASAPAAT
uniref:Ss18, like 2 n=1 Tax=Gasterosteus aculeatus aculeatus TaxID=481459 RepID=A0AAQ4R3L3_GASAC